MVTGSGTLSAVEKSFLASSVGAMVNKKLFQRSFSHNDLWDMLNRSPSAKPGIFRDRTASIVVISCLEEFYHSFRAVELASAGPVKNTWSGNALIVRDVQTVG